MISEHIHDLIQSVETEFFAVACIGTVFDVDVDIYLGYMRWKTSSPHVLITPELYTMACLSAFFYLFVVAVVWLVLASRIVFDIFAFYFQIFPAACLQRTVSCCPTYSCYCENNAYDTT